MWYILIKYVFQMQGWSYVMIQNMKFSWWLNAMKCLGL